MLNAHRLPDQLRLICLYYTLRILVIAGCLSDPVRRDAHEHVQPGEAVRPELRPRAQRQQDPQVVLTILRPAGAAAVETLLDSAVRAKSGDII